jgi:hypothetical protein
VQGPKSDPIAEFDAALIVSAIFQEPSNLGTCFS